MIKHIGLTLYTGTIPQKKKKSQVKAKLCTHGHNKRNIVMSKSDKKKKRHSDKFVGLTNHSASMEQAG